MTEKEFANFNPKLFESYSNNIKPQLCKIVSKSKSFSECPQGERF
jgi:hypothetical protein